MPAGMECYDEQGRLIVGLTTRLSRVVGYASIAAGVAGSVSFNRSYGEGWYFFVSLGTFPTVTVDNANGIISWANDGLSNMTMMYGVR